VGKDLEGGGIRPESWNKVAKTWTGIAGSHVFCSCNCKTDVLYRALYGTCVIMQDVSEGER